MVSCPGCGRGGWDYIGVHWSKKCGFPEIEKDIKDILVGVLMGDGWITKPYGGNKHHKLQIANTEREYLEYLDNQLGPYSTGVEFYRSAEEIASSAKKAGYETNVEDTNNQYILKTRAHPFFDTLREWYGEDGKELPADFPLTEKCIKNWYACDGGKRRGYIEIAAENEKDNQDIIARFKELDVEPIWDGHKIRFRQDDSVEMIDFMGEPVPGYEYKWNLS